MAYGSREIMVYDGDAEIADSQWLKKKLRVPQTRACTAPRKALETSKARPQ